MTTETGGPPTALLLLGCPQVPVQTSVAIHLCDQLRERGIAPVIAGTGAARRLIEIADPKRHYIGEVIDLDLCIDQIAEHQRDFDHAYVFIHNDAGVSYAGTISAISKARLVGIVYGEHADETAEAITFPCDVVAAKATHNPMPLVVRLGRVLP
ncbi:MAG TPA: DUF1890 domain-containing protein [Methanoregulaceae archaeon]|nr:DUF1890 domain-containing protein [Methanoregulaceae archaeon]HOV66929.1 DUF1890 domain-containing protein [Methanoregulaceae archaeon]HQJ87631.1 DUF1890 domain-containing protein [Methanoregulaceae archaeon]